MVRFSSLGDVILATPVYQNLREQIPGCRIFAAVKRSYAGILDGNPNLDGILALEDGEGIVSFLSRVRAENFDVLIDLHGNLRSAALRYFSGIPTILRYRKAALARRLFVSRRIKNPELGHHTVDRYLEPLKTLGITPKPYPPQIFPDRLGQSGAQPKILVVQTAFLGDAVLTTPLFAALRKQYPTAKIALLCSPEIRDIFSEIKEIDETWVMDKRGKDRSLMALWSLARRLKGQFDIAVVPHRSFRSALLVFLAGIPKRIGFGNSQGAFFFTDLIPFDWGTHDAERNLKLLEALGIAAHKPELKVPSGTPFDIAAFRKEHGIKEGDFIVGMNAGSVWNTKRWLPERFAEVADGLIEERGCKVILFGAKQDQAASDAVQRGMRNPCVNLCGKTNLKTLSALIARCGLFVTNDSGPMHIATAAGVPVVAVFGPTTRELGFFPYGKNSAVVEVPLDCRPCALHGGNDCPLGHFKCMKDITSEMVLAECRKFLS